MIHLIIKKERKVQIKTGIFLVAVTYENTATWATYFNWSDI